MTDTIGEQPQAQPTLIQRLNPSPSGYASLGIGAALADLIVSAIEAYTHKQLPTHISADIGVLVSFLVGWPFRGGRRVDTQ